jgi:hypothetical protein
VPRSPKPPPAVPANALANNLAPVAPLGDQAAVVPTAAAPEPPDIRPTVPPHELQQRSMERGPSLFNSRVVH